MIAVKITRRCMIGRDRVAQPGEIVSLSPKDAVDVIGCGSGEPLDPVLYAQACDELTRAALEIERKGQVRAPGAAPWSVRDPAAPAWSVLPGEAGYRPHVH